jgi:serralysin
MKGSVRVRLFVFLILVFAVFARVPVHPQGLTYFVAPTGSDNNPGTLGLPFRTIAKGTSVLGAGNTLFVRAGTYNEEILIDGTHANGTATTPITVTSYNGEAVTVKKIAVNGTRVYWAFNGMTVHNTSVNDDTVNVGGGDAAGSGAGFITFTNIEVIGYTGPTSSNGSCVVFSAGSQGSNTFKNGKVHNCDWPQPSARPISHGFYVSSPNNLIQGTEIYNVGQFAIHIYSDFPNSTTVNGNYIHDNGGTATLSGGILISGNNNLVMNNVVVNNANGIHFFDFGGTPTGNRAYNNTVYRSGNGNVGCGTDCYPAIYVGVSQSGADVRNNLVFGNLTSSVGNSGSGTVLGTNMTSNPGYLNATGGDFHLAAGSPAIDTGTTLSVVTKDRDGVSRPQGAGYDVGAYEHTNAGPRAPTNVHVSGS